MKSNVLIFIIFYITKGYATHTLCLQEILKEKLKYTRYAKAPSQISLKDFIDNFHKVNKHILDYSKNYTPPKEILDKVNDIYKRKDINLKEKAKLSYEIMLENELKILPHNLKQKLKRLNNNIEVIPVNSFKGNFRLSHKKTRTDQKIIVMIPERYIETPIDYAIRMHEMLHAIQWELLTNSNSSIIKSLHVRKSLGTLAFKSTKGLYYQEASSMAGEWRTITPIPIKERQLLAREILSDQSISEVSKEVALGIISSTERSGRSHIISEHKMGRYSKNNIINTMYHNIVNDHGADLSPSNKKINNDNEINILITSGIGGFILMVIVERMCESRTDEVQNFKETLFFKNICLNLHKFY